MEQQSATSEKKGSGIVFVGSLFALFTIYIFVIINAEVISQKYIQKRDTVVENMQTPRAITTMPREPMTLEDQQTQIEVGDDGRLKVRNGLAYWLKTDLLRGVEYNTAVQVLPDASNNNRTSFQQNKDHAPTLLESAINGLPAVRFDGANDHYVVGNVADQPTDATIFVVWSKPNAGGGAYQRLYSSAMQVADNGQPVFDYEVTTPGPALYAIVPSEEYGTAAAPPQLHVNTVKKGDLRNFVVGRLNTHLTQTALVDIGEIILYTRILSAAERAEVESYLKAKYKL